MPKAVLDSENAVDFETHKKQFISVQEKLVRVIGGMIITPIEFEIKDLRLMRIRNQFFIQLQTIDENKLRLATKVDERVTDLLEPRDPNTGELIENESGNSPGVERLSVLMDVSKSREEVERAIAELFLIQGSEKTNLEMLSNDAKLSKLLGEKKSLEEQMLTLMNLAGGELERNISPKEKDRRINLFFDRLDEYRALGIEAKAIYRNEKYHMISQILQTLGDHAGEIAARARQKIDIAKSKGKEFVQNDPFQAFFMAGLTESEESLQKLFGDEPEKLANLKLTDFSRSPMTPNFSFDWLSNDGSAEGEGRELESGLPARTFVGPITFLLNSNSSSLRPTDVLDEADCRDATCSVEKSIRKGVPPVTAFRAAQYDSEGERVDDYGVIELGDTMNAYYENNRFYGYLGQYKGLSVDDLIRKKEQIDADYVRIMEYQTEVSYFLDTIALNYVVLNDDPTTTPKDSLIRKVDPLCLKDAKVEDVQDCFRPVVHPPQQIAKKDLMAELNERAGDLPVMDYFEAELKANVPRHKQQSRNRVQMHDHIDRSNRKYYEKYGEQITVADLELIMKEGLSSPQVSEDLRNNFYHRFCFSLAKKAFLTPSKAQSAATVESVPLVRANSSRYLENFCHKQANALEEYKEQIASGKKVPGEVMGFPPIVVERKLRVKDTTKRYVYLDGKSMNINVGTNFNLNHGESISSGSSLRYNPMDVVKFMVVGAAGFALATASAPLLASAAFVGVILGGIQFNFDYGVRDQISSNDGAGVSSQAYLVNQQATLALELGEFERCMVVRLSPTLIHSFGEEVSGQRGQGHLLSDASVSNMGVFICAGRNEKKCEPIKEKYYYFTQHFTEGDMLDTADLHNHPWLLQLRGYRDFQTFMTLMEGRRHKYVDSEYYEKYAERFKSDLHALLVVGDDNISEEMVALHKEDGMDWPLKELGRAYFNVLPTFPGMYTHIENEVIKVNGAAAPQPLDYPSRDSNFNKYFDPKQCPIK